MTQNSNRLDAVINDGYHFQLSQYISKGFNIFGKNAGMFIGYLVVYFIISMGLSIIPLLGQLASFMISAALLAGFYIVADKTERGEYAQFSNFFDGFNSWLPLFLNTLLSLVIFLGIFIPFIAYAYFRFDGFTGLTEGYRPDFNAVDFLAIAVLFIVMILVGISFIYAPFFIIFDKMDAWEALMASRKVVAKNMLPHFLFLILWGLIICVSIIPLGLGLLVTLPAFYCSVYAAWADITDFNKEPNADDDLLRHLIG